MNSLKWTVLADNRTSNPLLETEHGLSILLETARHRVLLDGQESDDELFALGTRLKEKYPQTQFYTSHCTGDRAFQRLKSVMGPQLNTFI